MDLDQLRTILTTPDNVPIVLLLLVAPFYTWYGLRQALANDRLIAQLEADPEMAKSLHRKTQAWRPEWAREVHVWPYLLRIEFLAAIIVTIILMVWSIVLNAPLEEPANPTLTMNPSKAPWYFLGLMAIPYIDANPLGNGYYTFKQRKYSLLTFFFGFIVLWLNMIAIGTLIRGPGWMWFWPGTTWDHNRLIFEVNRDLPDIFGITTRVPKIIFGGIVVGLYLVAAGIGIHKLITKTAFNRKIYARMSVLQYVVMQTFLIIMLSLPVKILARLMFRIKYIWVTPWFNI